MALNIAARIEIRRRGWATIGDVLGRNAEGVDPSDRPLIFDEVECGMTRAFSYPGTSRRCTVVALSIYRFLISSGYAARIELVGVPDQLMFHSRARVGDHVVDPGDTHTEGPTFVRLAEGREGQSQGH